MGEMIGNIAHQWRQPLSSISIIASGAKFRRKVGEMDDSELEEVFNKITNHTKFLSNTIDDFRDFFKKDKIEVEFDILQVLNEAISLVEAAYKNNNITIHKHIKKESFFYKGYPRELLQVFLNMLNNAKDVLIEREIDEKSVIISIEDDNKSIICEFLDNGGGIEEDVMLKVFEPYFTTKHKSQGTGIGLFMSKEIVEKHLGGKLGVSNKTYAVNKKKHSGACFEIKLYKL